MDGAVLALFLAATFVGGLTTGLAGFAMGLVVSGIWLHILTPIQTASLIVGYGLLVQGYGTWKLRHAFDWRRVAPFILAWGAKFKAASTSLVLPMPLLCSSTRADRGATASTTCKLTCSVPRTKEKPGRSTSVARSANASSRSSAAEGPDGHRQPPAVHQSSGGVAAASRAARRGDGAHGPAL